MKKLVSLLLCLLMVSGTMIMMPVSASAEQTGDSTVSSHSSMGDVSVTGTNSLGNMLSQEMGDALKENKEGVCSINALEIDYRKAFVELYSLVDAKLIVAIFDESTNELFASASTDVTTEDTVVSVTFDINTLPQYYVVKAYLVEKDTYKPLCKEFVCDTYTQTKQQFLAMTPDDFDQSRVLTLDDQSDDNFLVYNDEVIIATGDADTNVITTFDDVNQHYVIDNIDKTILSLKSGDILSLTNSNDILIVNIASITIDGTTATIDGDETGLENVFEYIKLDGSNYAGEGDVTPNENSGVSYGGYEETATENTTTKEKVYLNPGEWNKDGAWFAAYFWKNAEDKSQWVELIDTNNDGLFEADAPDTEKWDRVIFCRMDASLTEFSWDSKWNQTQDLVYNGFNNCFVVDNPWSEEDTGYWDYAEIEEVSTYSAKKDVASVGGSADIATTADNEQIADGDVGFSKEHRFDFDKEYKNVILEGYALFQFNANVRCYYYPELFKTNEIDFSMSVGVVAQFHAYLEMESEIEIPLMHVCVPVFGVVIVKFTPSFVLEGKASLNLNGTLTGQIGKHYKNGVATDNNIPLHFDIAIKGAIELFIGLEFEPEVSILETVGVAFEVETGLLYSGEIVSQVTIGNDPSLPEEKHDCNTCMKGEVSWVFLLEYRIEIFNIKILESEEPLTFTKPIDQMYYSFDYDTFAFTACPYYYYKQTVIVVDENHDVIEDVSVDGAQKNSDGENILYLTGGKNTITIDYKGITSKVTYEVKGAGAVILELGADGKIKTYDTIAQYDPNALENGRCGDNAYWHVYDNGLLLITGTGSTYDYDPYNSAPFSSKYKYTIKKVVIGDGITRVGDYTFAFLESMTEIHIGKGVTSIEYGSFSNCRSITEIYVPGNVGYIGMGAFAICQNLRSITFAEGVTKLDTLVFENDYNLQTVRFSDTVSYLGTHLFDSCENLKNVYIGTGMKYIDMCAFETTPSLQNVYYSGTEFQWGLVFISIYNGYLLNAKIHYNTSFATPDTMSLDKSTDIATTGNQKAEIASTGASSRVFNKNHLESGSQALLIVAKESENGNIIDESNLIYIEQTTVNEYGVATFTGYGDFTTYSWDAYIFGYCDHSSTYWKTITECTDFEEGQEVCICELCNEIVETKIIPPVYDPSLSQICGDTDLDEKITIVDAQQIQLYCAYLCEFNAVQLRNADVNLDSKASIMDVTHIQRYLASLSCSDRIGKSVA